MIDRYLQGIDAVTAASEESVEQMIDPAIVGEKALYEIPNVEYVWQPIGQMPGLAVERRGARALHAFGRLSPRATLGEARSEIETIGARLAEAHPDTNADVRPGITPFTGSLTAFPLYLALSGAVAFVLLIACANVACLLLARSAQRAREISIRASIGASRGRLVRQLLIESLLLALVAGAVGLALSVLTAVLIGTGRLGWAVLGLIASGTVSFRPSRYDGGGIRYLRFRGWLDQLAEDAGPIAAVHFEEVRRHAGTDAAHVYGGFLATLTAWAETAGIAYQGVPVGTIKRHATGKGNADKAAMMAAARARGFRPADGNEADAIAILFWALETRGGVQ